MTSVLQVDVYGPLGLKHWSVQPARPLISRRRDSRRPCSQCCVRVAPVWYLVFRGFLISPGTTPASTVWLPFSLRCLGPYGCGMNVHLTCRCFQQASFGITRCVHHRYHMACASCHTVHTYHHCYMYLHHMWPLWHSQESHESSHYS